MNPAPYEAVILAAGRGSRLAEETGELPKAILPIGPLSLIDDTPTNFLRRQVDLLYAAGVERIVVVVGYLRDLIEEEISRWPHKPRLVVNPTPEIQTSGSLHSFQYAVKAGVGVLDGDRQMLLMESLKPQEDFKNSTQVEHSQCREGYILFLFVSLEVVVVVLTLFGLLEVVVELAN